MIGPCLHRKLTAAAGPTPVRCADSRLCIRVATRARSARTATTGPSTRRGEPSVVITPTPSARTEWLMLARRLRQPHKAGVVDGGQRRLKPDRRQSRTSGVDGHEPDRLHQSAPGRSPLRCQELIERWVYDAGRTARPSQGGLPDDKRICRSVGQTEDLALTSSARHVRMLRRSRVREPSRPADHQRVRKPDDLVVSPGWPSMRDELLPMDMGETSSCAESLGNRGWRVRLLRRARRHHHLGWSHPTPKRVGGGSAPDVRRASSLSGPP